MSRHAPFASHRWFALAAVALLGLAPAAARGRGATPAPGSPPAGAVALVAAGLTNPRGLAFGPDGTLYVALAGKAGATSSVVAVRRGCPVPVAGGFPTGGVVFSTVTGVADVAFLGDRLYALVAGGANDLRGLHNGLYRLDGRGGATLVADVSAFIHAHPVAARPRDYGAAGQPYALVPMGDAFWATEGNSNQLLRLGLDGTVTRVVDLSVGHPIPTGIAPAPGGGAYVAFFTHAPYADGTAKVIKVMPDGTVTTVWTGLTLVTALAVGPDGALYALELATGIDPKNPASIKPGTGKVVRRSGPTTAMDVVTGLALPTAMRFGPDGALDIAAPAFGADGGQGTIVRVELAAGRPVAVPAAPVPTQTCP